jgi:hypothetical protein
MGDRSRDDVPGFPLDRHHRPTHSDVRDGPGRHVTPGSWSARERRAGVVEQAHGAAASDRDGLQEIGDPGEGEVDREHPQHQRRVYRWTFGQYR